MQADRILDLMEEDWDIAIILDACRYDYYKIFYRYFFDGELHRAVSKGSCTPEWFRKTFIFKYDDTVYISANPFINSYPFIIKGCYARARFHRIVDVWAKSWDSKLGTVLPQSVNKYLLRVFKEYSGKRIIVHYLQPHAPYLSPKYFVIGFGLPDILKGSIFSPSLSNLFKQNVLYKHKNFLHKLEISLDWSERIAKKIKLGNGVALKLREVLKLPPRSPLDATRRLCGIRGLRNAYIINLLIVLETLAYILEDLEGRIVITSDHGEFLGEKNMFRHPCGVNDPILRCIPYFIVKRVKKPKKPVFSLYPLKLKIRLMSRLRE